MNRLKPVTIRDDLVSGHEIFFELDPFVTQSLIDVLKFMKFKVDPTLSKIDAVFQRFDGFAYRIDRRKLKGAGGISVDWATAYHEGFHNLVGLRFGTERRGRPLMTLLNESLGVGLEIYFMAKLALTKAVDMHDLHYVQNFERNAKAIGVSFNEKFREAMRDPFEVFRQCALDSFAIHKKIFDIVKDSRVNPEKKFRELKRELARSKRKSLIWICTADLALPAIYLAANCGKVSTKEDREKVRECLNVLKGSKSMDDFFVKLGAKEYSIKEVKRSA